MQKQVPSLVRGRRAILRLVAVLIAPLRKRRRAAADAAKLLLLLLLLLFLLLLLSLLQLLPADCAMAK